MPTKLLLNFKVAKNNCGDAHAGMPLSCFHAAKSGVPLPRPNYNNIVSISDAVVWFKTRSCSKVKLFCTNFTFMLT